LRFLHDVARREPHQLTALIPRSADGRRLAWRADAHGLIALPGADSEFGPVDPDEPITCITHTASLFFVLHQIYTCAHRANWLLLGQGARLAFPRTTLKIPGRIKCHSKDPRLDVADLAKTTSVLPASQERLLANVHGIISAPKKKREGADKFIPHRFERRKQLFVTNYGYRLVTQPRHRLPL
jgi:hypothetical protein